MSYRLSLLDKSPIMDGESASQALHRTLHLAQRAEAWGYHRFWLAEHHNISSLGSPSPELMIAWIIGQTKRIRVGSGGVMLQHYSPFKVAENFNLLASLAPGRIDLGVGKAPGGFPLSTKALQLGVHQDEKGDFAEQLALLDNWLNVPSESNEDILRATPQPPLPANRFLLGASEQSAQLAAQLGWQLVFAAHHNGDPQLMERVLTRYHQLSKGNQALVAVQVVVADSSATADRLLKTLRIYHVTVKNGPSVNVGSIEEAERFVRQGGYSDYTIAEHTPSLLKGTAEQVHAKLDALHQAYGIEEFVIDTPLAEEQARVRSLELLANQRFNNV